MIRAVLYARVSSARQAADDRTSLPEQRELFEDRCIERGYVPSGEYIEVESGTKVTRSVYQSMLADARAGKFDVIVVRAIDRFGRDANEILVRTAELDQCGVTIDALKSSVDDRTDPEMRILIRAFEAVGAQRESKTISLRTRAGREQKARDGYTPGRAPYGYRKLDGKLVIHPEEAAVVRRIFSWYLDDNMGFQRIARTLNGSGMLSRTGAIWSPRTVRYLLTRPAYAGVLRWSAVEIPDAIPQLVTLAEWDAVQRRIERKSELPAGQTQTSENLLAGILFCAHCEGRMHGAKSRHGVRQYRCRTSRFGACEFPNYHNAESLEAAVIGELAAAEEGFSKVQNAVVGQVETLRAARAAAQRAADDATARRRRAIDGYTRGAMTDDEYRDAIEIIDADRARALSEAERLTTEVENEDRRIADLQSLPIRILSLTDMDFPFSEKKRILQTYVKRIEVRQGDPEPYFVA